MQCKILKKNAYYIYQTKLINLELSKKNESYFVNYNNIK